MEVADGLGAQDCCAVLVQAGGEGVHTAGAVQAGGEGDQAGGSAVQAGAAGEGTAQSSARANMLAVGADAAISNGMPVDMAILVTMVGSSVDSGRASAELAKSARESVKVVNMLRLDVYMLYGV